MLLVVRRSGCRMSAPGGFTLTELAVVLVIVALLVGGLLIPLSAQIDAAGQQRHAASAGRDSRGAAGFCGRQRPPAVPGARHDGKHRRRRWRRRAANPAGCNNPAGVLPWVTLGLAETDAWGRRYTYRLTPEFGGDVGGTYSGLRRRGPGSFSLVHRWRHRRLCLRRWCVDCAESPRRRCFAWQEWQWRLHLAGQSVAPWRRRR
ncbi:prepilin-type N-terminal cleavage/methylation domain-containing protein [Accumulibacter sp.]|uniref:prepilin-type N-terminal cleavage/methylation domain-containing protein n=1 Tax=Accumulibacter sp. TaxID=2053492 RepID=UPI003418FC91